ncbi:putative tetrahydrocannabinolic acid synthase [Helianthus anomalus]
MVFFSSATSQRPDNKYLQCLLKNSNATKSDFVFTQQHTKYSSVLQSSTINLRYSTSKTPKPLAIITPLTYSHVQSAGYNVQLSIKIQRYRQCTTQRVTLWATNI